MDPEIQSRLREARELDRSGQQGRATLAYKLILRAAPDCQEARVDLAGLLMVLGRFEEARDLCGQVLEARPGDSSAIQNLIGALLGLEQYEEAEDLCRGLLQADPACAPAYLGLGMSLVCRDRHLEAEPFFLKAQAFDPGDTRARNALFRCQIKSRSWSRAFDTWMDIAEKDMEGPRSLFEKGVILLAYGQFEQGWELYENRFDRPDGECNRQEYAQPLWDGEPFPGRTLLLWHEQGFGDTLMFIRYAALAKQRGGRVIALVQPQVLPALGSCEGVDQWLTPGEPLPPFDIQLPLLSLPRIFKTRRETIPARVPYLVAPPPSAWVDAAVAPSPNLKVGLVWAGNLVHKQDFLRTIPLETLEPLSRIPGVDWYSLQLNYGAGLPWEGIRDLSPVLKDFGDTARVLQKLDLLISVDTAVAHLAGALGRPVWLMLPLVPDWRWGLEQEASPWYPSHRIFGQHDFGHWEDVIGRIGDSLSNLRGTC